MISEWVRAGIVGTFVLVGSIVANAIDAKADPDKSLVEHGRYVALAADCMPCHTASPDNKFAGGLGINTPFGTIYSPNITPDPETGIGKWTFDNFKNAVHNGIRADGAYLYPAMPYTHFTKIEEADLKALWAYLRSLPPIKKARKENGLSFPFSIRSMMFFWRVLFFDEGFYQTDKTKSAGWNRGAYLVEALAHCGACHTPRNLMGATIPSERFEGSHIDTWFAPNITPEALKKINKWDKADLIDFLKKGATSDSTTLGPMQVVVHDSLSKLKESDIADIATFMFDDDAGKGEKLRPPKVAKLAPKVEARAKKLFDSHCAVCHQKTGKGMTGRVPPLAGNPTVVAAQPYNILSAVLQGVPARNGLLAMPSFASTLTDQDIADIANYVRTSWGNEAAPNATPHLVASWRSQVTIPATGAAAKTETKPATDTSETKPAAEAPAASTPAAAPSASTTAKRKPFFIVSNDVVGLQVRSEGEYSQTLGTLSGLIIDSSSGQTLYAVIDRGGFLGFDQYKVVVPFQLVDFTGQWDSPMLAMSAFKLAHAPRITDEAVEDLLQNPDWRRSVAAYFGVALAEPGQAAAPPRSDVTDKSKPSSDKAGADEASHAETAAERGKEIAQTQCSACHTFNKGGGTRVGPNLYGVYGTKIASKPGFSFSAALKKHTGIWDKADLNEWLKSPSTFAPGTYMTFPGLPSQEQRDDVIAYLKSLSTGGG
ncbi:MAG: c-type cytochrome [Hyphomicrobium sp.]